MTTSTSQTTTKQSPGAVEQDARLARVREALNARGLDALLVRSTDRYLNEYVPEAESTRQWVSGFTGSMGDALITLTEAFIVVDGRYHLQAEQEVTAAWGVVKLSLAEPIFVGLCNVLGAQVRAGKIKRVGIEVDRCTLAERDTLERLLEGTGARLEACLPSPLDALRGAVVSRPGNLRVLDEAAVGRTSKAKVEAIQKALLDAGQDLFIVEKLDDLAYLTNLRADELPYQATFKGMAAVGRTGALVCFHTRKSTPEVDAARPAFRFVPEPEFSNALASITGGGTKAAVDAVNTTDATRQLLIKAGFSVAALNSPLTEMKAKKTPEELARMVAAFRTADGVVNKAQRWLCSSTEKGLKITEADFARRVEQLFKRSGAVGLSFKVISAAGANGAVIHYSTPSTTRVIEKGELMLLDTGAYYGEGYATDLTRTFLVGGPKTVPTAEQKRLYTLTLKAAIAGMTAVMPAGVPGVMLDAITRKPLWDAGLNYNHGTGHGVGINVHEAPPSVSMRSQTPLQPGYVFSIEPGVYLAGWGGIRIENLCTLEEHPEFKGYLRVKVLTFSPLDLRLVDKALLSPAERAFVKDFQTQAKATLAQ